MPGGCSAHTHSPTKTRTAAEISEPQSAVKVQYLANL